MTTPQVTQSDLDELSKQLAGLNTDQLVVTIVNSRIERSTPFLAAISVLNLIAILSSLIENEQDRHRVAAAMFDVAGVIDRPKSALN